MKPLQIAKMKPPRKWGGFFVSIRRGRFDSLLHLRGGMGAFVRFLIYDGVF